MKEKRGCAFSLAKYRINKSYYQGDVLFQKRKRKMEYSQRGYVHLEKTLNAY